MPKRSEPAPETLAVPLPRFEIEAEERAYWEREVSGEHLDKGRAERVVLPYQSLIKVWLAEKVDARDQ